VTTLATINTATAARNQAERAAKMAHDTGMDVLFEQHISGDAFREAANELDRVRDIARRAAAEAYRDATAA
jgi:triphosphoribosyl-dephospho-CoA synthetase